jgi:hypothetical protein
VLPLSGRRAYGQGVAGRQGTLHGKGRK